ncbi:MAG: GGDEF domain-containing protein [Lachnospiraceae bacterium]|nr:GGDEF domain-containing protein [Lachnospiraceae bacterium]
MNGSYMLEQLERFSYFQDLLKKKELEEILDPLTGVVSRAYIIEFAKKLIEEKVSFTFVILDLDNFKFINDTYGHAAGDGVLMDVSSGIVAFLDGYGVIGRFGGDEFLMINFRDLAYDEKKAFLNDLYETDHVLRKNVRLKDCSPFITGTIGCATFPDDASDYEGLFDKIDKALYRGKTKGRNCYIIYVESKHKDLVIRKSSSTGIYSSMQNLVRQFEMVPGIRNKLHSILPLLMEILRITDLYYVGKNGLMHGVLDTDIEEDVSDINNLINDDLFSSNDLSRVAENCPRLYGVLTKRNVESALVVRVGLDDSTDGYLLLAEPGSKRIWQEDERALMYFLSKLLASRIRIDGENILV